MEIDDLKKVWTKLNDDTGQPVYTADEIASFRKARSKDFSTWIQNGLVWDIIFKSILILAFIVLIVLLGNNLGFIISATAVILLSLLLILIEARYLKSSKDVDRKYISVQEGIKAKLKFLKTYYYKIQFLQGLSNPIFVFAGVSFYYYQKYGDIRFESLKDVIILLVLLVVSFLFTLPTTFSLYGYHYRILKATIASLENEESWILAIKKYEKQKRILTIVFASLILVGVITLAALLLF